jgi:hypothetical protein
VINYSRKEMERQLLADQTLWARLPGLAAAIVWPLEVLLLGWGTGWWTGALTVVALGFASVLLPGRLGAGIYLVDLLDWSLKWPLKLGWLLMVWHLWLREPVLPVLGQPLVGALAITALLILVTRLLSFASRLAAGRVGARANA